MIIICFKIFMQRKVSYHSLAIYYATDVKLTVRNICHLILNKVSVLQVVSGPQQQISIVAVHCYSFKKQQGVIIINFAKKKGFPNYCRKKSKNYLYK